MPLQQFTLGINSSIKLEEKNLFNLLEEDIFNRLEIPANFLKNMQVSNYLRDYNFEIEIITNMLESTISKNLIFQSYKFQHQIYEELNKLLSYSNTEKIKRLVIDLGFLSDKPFNNYDRGRIKFLKKFCYRLYYSNISFCIPTNLFNYRNIYQSALYFDRIFEELMYDKFKICLNIFPQHFSKTLDLFNIIDDFPDLGVIRLIYNPKLEFQTLNNSIISCLKSFKKANINSPVVISPQVSSIDMLHNEIKRINKHLY